VQSSLSAQAAALHNRWRSIVLRLGGYAVEMPMISIELSLWLVDRGDGNPNICGVTVTTRLIPVRFQLIC
jgi:hypothetical protein